MTNSTYFTTRFQFDKRRSYVWNSIAKNLQKYIPLTSTIIELGAGYADFINSIQAKEKWALDISFDLRHYANSDVNCINESILKSDLKLPSAYFDVVFVSNFLEHFTSKELETIMERIQQILKKNGLFIIIQPNYRYCYREYFDDYTHSTVFSHVSLQNFLESKQFSIRKLIPRYLPFSMKSSLSFGYKLTNLYLRLPFRPFARQMLIVSTINK